MTDARPDVDLRAMRDEAAWVAKHLTADEPTGALAARMERLVVRPLGELLSGGADRPEESAGRPEPSSSTDARLWELTKALTALSASESAPTGLFEAAAGAQEVYLRHHADVLGADDVDARWAELTDLQAELPAVIRVVADGPLLLTGAAGVTDHLGCAIPTRPIMALCRCGGSTIKPACDGECATSGFTDAKDPNRVPDRQDTYVGLQVTVLDNRGICQHSGYCTDRLSTVFRAGEEPFVAPSGGRMDEIIRAVRDCPSGALSYAIDGIEARGQVDHASAREPAVEVTKDGPYRVTGGIPLTDAEGANAPRAEGSSLEHYALCRCGQSQNKPFCSGMHWYVNFHDPIGEPDRVPSVFEWAGGLPALARMTRLFYEKHVPADPLLAPVFANMADDHPERVAKWLGEVFGGPAAYSEHYGGYPRMISEHLGKGLTEELRQRWVTLLLQSAKEAGLPNDAEFRAAFSSYIEWGSRLAVENSQTGAKPPERMPMPSWDWNTAAGAPGSRISALAPAEPVADEPTVLPGPDEVPGYDAHIKALFRAQDRNSMSFVFDLGSYDDVREHADAILARLRDGSMPCDGAWPPERVDVFARWIDSGHHP